MFKTNKKYILFLLCFLLIGFISIVSAEECQFICKLDCNKIGPKPVDSKARGEITFQLNENKQELIYNLEVEEINDVYMAHIHIGPNDKQGPIAVWLYPLKNQNNAQRCIEGEFSGTLANGTIKPEDIKEGITFNDLIEAMRNGNAYVNVHSKKFVPGEIRGQVHPNI